MIHARLQQYRRRSVRSSGRIPACVITSIDALLRTLCVDSRLLKNNDVGTALDEDTRAFRELAKAIEAAARGHFGFELGLSAR